MKSFPEAKAALPAANGSGSTAAAADGGPLLDCLLTQLDPVLQALKHLAEPAARARIPTKLMLGCLSKLVCFLGPDAPCCVAFRQWPPHAQPASICLLHPCSPHWPRPWLPQERVECAPHFWIDRYGLAISPLAGRSNPFAWHVDHRVPVACGGATDAGNLDAVQHRFNHYKQARCAAGTWVVGVALQPAEQHDTCLCRLLTRTGCAAFLPSPLASHVTCLRCPTTG